MSRGTDTRGPHDTRPPSRPPSTPRPACLAHIRTSDRLVDCRHPGCYHLAGPYLDRDATIDAAVRHYKLNHEGQYHR